MNTRKPHLSARIACGASLDEHLRLTGRKQALYGILQGGEYRDLRERAGRVHDKAGVRRLRHRRFVGQDQGRTCTRSSNGACRSSRRIGPGICSALASSTICSKVWSAASTRSTASSRRVSARTGAVYVSPEEAQGRRFRLNLFNAHYRDDARPIDASCACYTCRKFSRLPAPSLHDQRAAGISPGQLPQRVVHHQADGEGPGERNRRNVLCA